MEEYLKEVTSTANKKSRIKQDESGQPVDSTKAKQNIGNEHDDNITEDSEEEGTGQSDSDEVTEGM